MAFCKVSYCDVERINHTVQVEGDTLYEAVAAAINRFRRDDWAGQPPGPGCKFDVEVLQACPVKYSIDLGQLQTFAKHGTARGPADILRKKRIRELLGIKE